MDKTEETLYKAALLHDVGKFWQRTRNTDTYKPQGRGQQKHQELSKNFIDQWLNETTISHIVANHHKTDWKKNKEQSERHTLALIACEADTLASGERIFEYRFQQTSIESIFNQIKIERKEKEDKYPQEKYFQPFCRLVPEDYFFPINCDNKEAQKENLKDYEFRWDEFIKEITNNPNLHPDTVLNLYKKYLWCAPASSFMNKPDISLYEHSRLTAAIAICLYRTLKEQFLEIKNIPYHNVEDRKTPHYILLGGGFSGIQKYLYGIAHKGALKALKGRSFWLNQAVETMGRYILNELDLPLANLIYANGGRFYLLLPASAENKLLAIRENLEQQIYEQYEGQLGLELGHIYLTGEEIGSRAIAQKWDSLVKIIEKSKNQPFLTRFDAAFFSPSQMGGKLIQCQFTKKDMIPQEVFYQKDKVKDEPSNHPNYVHYKVQNWKKETGYEANMYAINDATGSLHGRLICEEQFTSQQVGRKIRETSILAIHKSSKADFDLLKLESFTFHDSINRNFSKPSNESQRILFFNDDGFLDYPHEKNIEKGWRFYGGEWILRDYNNDDKVKDFEILAEESTGIKRLGVLRMDVDNLGELFAKGLGDSATFSRITQLSTMMDFFFCGYLNKLRELYWKVEEGIIEKAILSTEEQNQAERGELANIKYLENVLQIVYAGGDDLFIIGLWNVLPDVALWINQEFKKFTNNKNFTISGGISLFRAGKIESLYLVRSSHGQNLKKCLV